MASFRIRPVTWEVTYEIAFLRSGFSLLDAPGKLCDAFIEKLEPYGVTGGDFQFEGGHPGDRALICDLAGVGGTLTVRGDRLETYFSDGAHADKNLQGVLAAIWQAFEMAWPGVQVRDHSILLEIEAEILDRPYQEFLNAFASIPANLPTGTQSAVVFYLPADPKLLGRESSLVFNRTDDDARPLLLNATLVYSRLDPAHAVEAAWDRLGGLLGALEISLVNSVSDGSSGKNDARM